MVRNILAEVIDVALQHPSPRRPLPSRAKRALYWRRRLVVLGLLISVGLLCWGAVRLVQVNLDRIEPSLGFKIDRHLLVSDDLRVAVGLPSPAGYRPLALVQGSGKATKRIGGDVAVKADLPLSIRRDLGPIPVLWAEQVEPVQGAPRTVEIPGGKATAVSGGEPIPVAWLILEQGFMAVKEPVSLLAPSPPPHPTGIVVDLDWNALWYFEEGQLKYTARVSTGQFRKGPPISGTNWQQNHLTPRGEFKVERLQEGMEVTTEKLPAGHPLNPYGSRWIGFSVLKGDNASIWAIHGTHNPGGIGKWNTNGTIAMRNEDVEALYQRVKEGLPIVIRGGE